MPYIFLSGQDNRVTGNGGCNVLNGSFTLSGDNGIQFGQMVASRMMCMDMETETKLLTALQEADNFTVNAGVLTLNKGQESPLARFRFVE
ncbi:MAG: META domain-containing protein [Mangrovibacterium sp.]